MIVFHNGNLVPASEARISVFDSSFMHGFGLFETMRAYQGRVFRLGAHIDRLMNGASLIFLRTVEIPERAYFEDACNKVIKENKLMDARVRITLTPGLANNKLPGEEEPHTKPTIVIIALELEETNPEIYQSGVDVCVIPGLRSSYLTINALKSVSYATSRIALQLAWLKGYYEALFVNEHGYITEGSMSNLFIVRDNAIKTPLLDDGALPGIARAAIIDLAKENSYQTKEAHITTEDLKSADEVFITNSVRQVIPVRSVEGNRVFKPAPGKITSSLIDLYNETVKRELALDQASIL